MISGGEPLPRTLRDAFLKRFNVPLLRRLRPDRNQPGGVAEHAAGAQRPAASASRCRGATVKITDDDGNALPTDKIGEVWLKGPMIMKGYYNLPNETAAALTADGYFKTGDLGKIDADGFLYITGRKKDMIIVAGEKASPREIEDTLLRHPAVADAAVLGKKDPSRGEVVVAFVIPKEGQTVTADELAKFLPRAGTGPVEMPARGVSRQGTAALADGQGAEARARRAIGGSGEHVRLSPVRFDHRNLPIRLGKPPQLAGIDQNDRIVRSIGSDPRIDNRLTFLHIDVEHRSISQVGHRHDVTERLGVADEHERPATVHRVNGDIWCQRREVAHAKAGAVAITRGPATIHPTDAITIAATLTSLFQWGSST